MAVGDAYRKVSSGERLIIPAAFHNATVDVIRAFKASAFDLDSLHSATDKQATVIKFQNDTGRDLDQWDVLGIGGPLVTPAGNFNEFARQVAVSGGLPTERGKFGILLEPINAGHIGRAYASGVTIAKVRFTGESDTRADVDTGETSQLKTDPYGGAFILWKGTPVDTSGGYYSGSGGSDVYWCIVRLSNPLGGSCPQTELRFFDIKCEGGKLKKYYTPIVIVDGCPQAGVPVFAGEAGCCDCPGGGSGSGSGSGIGTSGGGTGTTVLCCPGVEIPSTLYATISAPGVSWLDGEVIPLSSPGDGSWSGIKHDGTPNGCHFPIRIECCSGLGSNCTSWRINCFLDPTLYISGPCTGCGIAPDSCSCDPFILIFSQSYNGFDGTNPGGEACINPRFRCGTGCRPPAGICGYNYNCSNTITITITT